MQTLNLFKKSLKGLLALSLSIPSSFAKAEDSDSQPTIKSTHFTERRRPYHVEKDEKGNPTKLWIPTGEVTDGSNMVPTGVVLDLTKPEELLPNFKAFLEASQFINNGGPVPPEKTPTLAGKATSKFVRAGKWGAGHVASFGNQYFFFQLAMGVIEMANLAMSYSSNPTAREKFWKSALSTEGVVGFAGFVAADQGFQKLVRKFYKNPGPMAELTISNFGMSLGMTASSVIGELYHDRAFQQCATSEYTDLESCDTAYKSWVLTNKIVDFIPMLAQNFMSGSLSALANSAVLKARSNLKANKVEKYFAGREELKDANKIEKFMAFKAEKRAKLASGIYARVSRLGLTSSLVEKGVQGSVGVLANGLAMTEGLVIFMGIDGLISSPIMDWFMSEYVSQKRNLIETLLDDPFEFTTDIIKTASFGTITENPINVISDGVWSALNFFMPTRFPKFDQGFKDFKPSTYAKFWVLMKDLNITANAKKIKPDQAKNWLTHTWAFMKDMTPKQIQDLSIDRKYINYPQDDWKIVKEAHQAVVESVKFEKANSWKEITDIRFCNKDLPAAQNLKFQDALNLIVLSEKDRNCLINTNLYDNLAMYITLNLQNRQNLLGKATAVSTDWLDATTRFNDLFNIYAEVTSHFVQNMFALKQGLKKYRMYTSNGKFQDLDVFNPSYESVQKLVDNATQGKDRFNCMPGEDPADCEERRDESNNKFLPQWVGRVKINSVTDYIIAQMACGPDAIVKTQSSMLGFNKRNEFGGTMADSFSQQQFTGITGRIAQKIGQFSDSIKYQLSGRKDEYRPIADMSQEFVSPHSQMVQMAWGSYVHFIPPRLTSGNGNICQTPLSRSTAVERYYLAPTKADYIEHSPKSAFMDANDDRVFQRGQQKIYTNLIEYISQNMLPNLLSNSDVPDKNISNYIFWYDDHVTSVFNESFLGLQKLYSTAMEKLYLPVLTTTKCTENCDDTTGAQHKVARGVYKAIDVELKLLFAVLNEIYANPVQSKAHLNAQTAKDWQKITQEIIQKENALILSFQNTDINSWLESAQNGQPGTAVSQSTQAVDALVQKIDMKNNKNFNELQMATLKMILDELASLLQQRKIYAMMSQVTTIHRDNIELPHTKHRPGK